MNVPIVIVSNEPVKDSEGFVTNRDNILTSVRAYKEERHGSEAWKNRAAFSTASALFRFRRIPDLEITTSMFIVCSESRYNIISIENVKNRNMYVEILAEKIQPSGG